jgi:hypothetical protein
MYQGKGKNRAKSLFYPLPPEAGFFQPLPWLFCPSKPGKKADKTRQPGQVGRPLHVALPREVRRIGRVVMGAQAPIPPDCSGERPPIGWLYRGVKGGCRPPLPMDFEKVHSGL